MLHLIARGPSDLLTRELITVWPQLYETVWAMKLPTRLHKYPDSSCNELCYYSHAAQCWSETV